MQHLKDLLEINKDKYDYLLVPLKNVEALEDIPLPSIAISDYDGVLLLDSKRFVVNNTRLSDEIEKCEHGK